MISDITQLPEDSLSYIISLTTPRDASVISAVSPSLKSAADSDATWQRFLPSDLASILSRAVNSVEYESKKELFLRLSDDHVLIDGGKLSFGLERSNGAKCFMISARALSIVWGGDERYWKWVPLSESRFSEGAELLAVCWLEIHGNISMKLLSPQTQYIAHLIFKMTDQAQGLRDPPQDSSISIHGQIVSTRSLCVQVNNRRRIGFDRWVRLRDEMDEVRPNVMVPKERGDGWMEIEMGEFSSGDGDDGDVEVSLKEINGGHWKKGLVLQGIEIRVKG